MDCFGNINTNKNKIDLIKEKDGYNKINMLVKEISHNIRNLKTLTDFEKNVIQNELNNKDLVELIYIYDEVIKSFDDFLPKDCK